MTDSGVVSLSSSGSVDISLDALEISSTQPSDSSTPAARQPLPRSTSTAMPVGNRSNSVEKTGPVAATDPASSELQSDQKPIAELLSKTGYSIVQANGQRRYGPPPDWQGPPPQRGCEVFVGKVPRDCFEDELVPVFERVGKIYELRLMLDHYTGLNRGYCFVVFSRAAEAKECVRQLNNYEIRKGRTLGICMSVDNCRLFVGGIPKKVNKEDILQEMRKVTEGVVDVIVYPSASDKSKNRGFAFVEYESHRSAAMARRKLMNNRVDLWGHNIAVDWAEPELEVDEEIMAQVKVLYVRNLMLATTELQILDAFSVYGNVERVKKIKDYAFVHFQVREEAHKAMEAMNGTVLDGAQVEVTLAKPVDRDTYSRAPKLGRPCTGQPAFYVPVDQYGSILPCYPYFSPPRYMLRNSMGACAMVQVPRPPPPPPNQQRPVSPGASGVRAGPGATPTPPGGMFYPVTFTGPAPPRLFYPPTSMHPNAVPFYPSSPPVYYEQPVGMAKRSPDQVDPELAGPSMGLPGQAMMEVPPPTPSGTLKTPKTCSMLLEEICQKHNWGSPIYSLHSSTNTTASGEPDTLFLYKATVVGLGMTYIPSKLCRNLPEAREIAAENALIQLGYPMEATATSFPAIPATPRPAGTIQYSDATPTMCPSSFMALTSPPKPGAWATPTDHAPIYANPYSENPFPTATPFSPEFYQPTPGY